MVTKIFALKQNVKAQKEFQLKSFELNSKRKQCEQNSFIEKTTEKCSRNKKKFWPNLSHDRWTHSCYEKTTVISYSFYSL